MGPINCIYIYIHSLSFMYIHSLYLTWGACRHIYSSPINGLGYLASLGFASASTFFLPFPRTLPGSGLRGLTRAGCRDRHVQQPLGRCSRTDRVDGQSSNRWAVMVVKQTRWLAIGYGLRVVPAMQLNGRTEYLDYTKGTAFRVVLQL